jgi:hypothetical protein
VRFADWMRPGTAFAVNGALYGSLLARFPEIADRVSASESQFGVALFAAAIGGLLGSLVAPRLTRAIGDFRAALVAGSGYAILAMAVTWAPDLILLGCALLLTGILDGAHDVTMNAAAVRAQQQLATVLMGRMHATWSLSLVGAGALGAAAAGLAVPVPLHIGLVVIVAIALQLIIVAGRRQPTPAGRSTVPVVTAPPQPPGSTGRGPAPSVRMRMRHVLPVLGVAAFAASYVESPGQEWTGLLLSRGLHAEPQVAASGPVLFAAGLVASRLALDGVQRRLGSRAVAIASGVTMLLGVLVGTLFAAAQAAPVWALAAIAVAGIGAGPVFPLLFGAADHLSVRRGIPAARTASIVSALSRIGAISAPVVVGPLTETLGMAMVFVVMAAGALLVLLALPRAAGETQQSMTETNGDRQWITPDSAAAA